MRSLANTEAQIMDALRDGPMTEAAVAGLLGVPVATAARRLRGLRPNVRRRGRNRAGVGARVALWELA